MLSPTPLGQNPADSTSFAPVRPLSVHVFTFHGHLGKTRNNAQRYRNNRSRGDTSGDSGGRRLDDKELAAPPPWAGREREAEGPQLRTLDRMALVRMYPLCISHVSHMYS